MQDKNDKLRNILESLSGIDKSDFREIDILSENGFDESAIVATQDSLLHLAEKLVKLILAINNGELNDFDDLEEDEGFGRNHLCTNKVKYWFNESADVWPVVLYIASDYQSQIDISTRLSKEIYHYDSKVK